MARTPRPVLSPQLRRYRRARMLAAGVLGAVCGGLLMSLLAQLGSSLVTWRIDLPWYVGIATGMLSSVAVARSRTAARRLRIRAAAADFRSRMGRAAAAGAMVAVVALAAGLSLLGAPPAAVAAGVDCGLRVSGDGVSGAEDVSDSTRTRPVVVEVGTARIVAAWSVPPEAAASGRVLRVSVDTGLRQVVVGETAVAQPASRYVVEDVPSIIPRGLHRVQVELLDADGEEVCRPEVGWVLLTGPLTDSPTAAASALGLVAGLGGTGLLLLRTRVDAWTFVAPRGVTLDLVDLATGRPLREPLRRGRTYGARLRVDWPDPPRAYADLPEPMDVLVGVVGAVDPLRSAPLRAGSREPVVVEFRVPSEPGPVPGFQLDVELTMRGLPQLGLRLVQDAAQPGSIAESIGGLSYDLGELTALRLREVPAVDLDVGMHSALGGEVLEIWGLHGTAGLRFAFRNTIRRERLAELADAYRQTLLASSTTWVGAAGADDRALERLAIAGAQLRRELVGTLGPLVPLDARVAITHDADALRDLTFPWGGLHLGEVDPDRPTEICRHASHDPCPTAQGARLVADRSTHGPQVLCPWDFWGIRYQLDWPEGWLPAAPEPARARKGRPWPAASRIGNAVPPRMLTVSSLGEWVPERLRRERADRGMPAHLVQERVCASPADWQRAFALLAACDLVTLVGHGGHSADGEFRFTMGEGEARERITGDRILQIAGGARFTSRPLLFLLACESGVVGLAGHHGLMAALSALGVGGVVVSETKIEARDALSTAAAVQVGTLRGRDVGRALLESRREQWLASGRLTGLALTYYGPPGLRLDSPVLDVAATTGPPGHGIGTAADRPRHPTKDTHTPPAGGPR